MNKLRVFMIVIVLFVVCLPGSKVIAAESEGIENGNEVTENITRQRVFDEYNLLSAEEINTLENYAAQIAEEYGMENVFVSSLSLDGKTPQDYADDYYDYNDFGVGDNKDGSLFLIDMDSRSYHISTCGEAIDALTDSNIKVIKNAVQKALSNGDFYDAVYSYMSLTEGYYRQYNESGDTLSEESVLPNSNEVKEEESNVSADESALVNTQRQKDEDSDGTSKKSSLTDSKKSKNKNESALSEKPAQAGSIDSRSERGVPADSEVQQNFFVRYEEWLNETSFFIVISMIVSGVLLSVLISKHKNVVKQRGADDYLISDSVLYTNEVDRFIRSNTVTRRIEHESPDSGRSTKDSSGSSASKSSGSRSSGASTHKSSSGQTHGGSGGSFRVSSGGSSHKSSGGKSHGGSGGKF